MHVCAVCQLEFELDKYHDLAINFFADRTCLVWFQATLLPFGVT